MNIGYPVSTVPFKRTENDYHVHESEFFYVEVAIDLGFVLVYDKTLDDSSSWYQVSENEYCNTDTDERVKPESINSLLFSYYRIILTA